MDSFVQIFFKGKNGTLVHCARV